MSNIAADHVYNPRNRGALENFTHRGVSGEPGNGPFVALWLLVNDGTIEKASYDTHGCIWSIACASVTAQLVTGRPVEKALLLEPKDIDLFLGGLPEGKADLAERSIAALRLALSPETGRGQ